MRLTLKRLLALLLCVCLCAGVAACSRSETPDGEAADSSEATAAPPSNGERFASALQTLSSGGGIARTAFGELTSGTATSGTAYSRGSPTPWRRPPTCPAA